MIENSGGFVCMFNLSEIDCLSISAPLKVTSKYLYKFVFAIFSVLFHQLLQNLLKLGIIAYTIAEMAYPLNSPCILSMSAFPNRVKTTNRFRKHLLGGLSMGKR